MESSRGLVVKSIAGRDKGQFQVIMSVEGNYVFVCDGKKRRVEKPKRKNLRHLQLTKEILPESHLGANKLIREFLRQL